MPGYSVLIPATFFFSDDPNYDEEVGVLDDAEGGSDADIEIELKEEEPSTPCLPSLGSLFSSILVLRVYQFIYLVITNVFTWCSATVLNPCSVPEGAGASCCRREPRQDRQEP